MTDLLQRGSPGSDRPRIDPRIAQRWIEARRQEGRRRLQAVLVCAAVAACLLLAWGSLYTPLFRVRHVRVTVDGPLAAQTVAGWSGISGRTQTIDVSSRATAARLDAHPALGAARVGRHWPGTVTIAVTVRVPVAVVALPAGYAEVDVTGRVVADVAAAPAGLPQLQGVASVPAPGGWLGGSPGAAAAPGSPPSTLVDMTATSDGPDVPSGSAAALAFLDALPPLLRGDVSYVSAGGGSAGTPGRAGDNTTGGSAAGKGLSLVVSPPRMASGTITVLLGDGSQLQAKADALVAVLDEGDLSGVAGLDLTVPSRPAAASTVAGLSPTAAAPVTSTSSPASTGSRASTASPAAAQASAAPPSGSTTSPSGTLPTATGKSTGHATGAAFPQQGGAGANG